MNAEVTRDLEARESQIRESAQFSKDVRFYLADQKNKEVVEEVKESTGFDVTDKSRFNIRHPMFRWGKVLESCHESAGRRMREANPLSAYSAIIRGYVNNYANNWYKLTKTVHEQIVAVTPSSDAIEPYAPIARGSTPLRTPQGTPFRETKLQGPADIMIANEKFGAIASAPWELFQDDKTGQIAQRIQDIGPNMALLEEAWVMGKFISPSGGTLYQGEIIPVSGTKPSIETSSTWPWSTALLGGGRNIGASYAVFSNNSVQQADYYLSIQKDQNQNFMAVDPDTLLVGPGLKFLGSQLLNSGWYPSTAAQLVGGGAVGSTATNLGTTFAENEMKGLYNLVVSRFLPSGACAIGQAHVGMVMQMREGLSVTQEAPNSGASFTTNEIRWRAMSRWMTEWIEPRFWFLMNDGTAT